MPSLLSSAGGSKAWARVRSYVLARDGLVCRALLADGSIHGIPLTTHDRRLPTHATVGHIDRRLDGGDERDLTKLRPECAHCNYSDGAKAGNRRRGAARLNTSGEW